MQAAVEHEGPMDIRIGVPQYPPCTRAYVPFRIGKGITMMQGRDVTIIATGTALWRAFDAAEMLRRKGIEARLISMRKHAEAY